MIERRRSAQKATLCPACGAHMRAATLTGADAARPTPVWRCIRCGADTPRLARRAGDLRIDQGREHQ